MHRQAAGGTTRRTLDHVSRASRAGVLVGREQELAELRAGLGDAELAHGRLFLISGDAGIGKTRLLEALAEPTGPTEARVLWGRCWEAGEAASYWPFVQVLRQCIDASEPDVLGRCLGPGGSEVAQLVPELAGRLPGLVPAPSVDSPQARVRLFDSVVGFLTAVAAHGPPLLVALEDLHAADEASLKLLRSLVRQLAGTRLLVVGTYRDAQLREWPERERLMAAIAAEGRTIRLAGLDRSGVARLIQLVDGRTPTVDRVTEVHRVTEGNPFFVGEVARLLAGEGRRHRVALPHEVHALIRGRLERAAPSVQQVLSRAALLGQEFELSVLRRLMPPGSGDDALIDALAQATALRLVDEQALGRWTFAHSLLREALYDRLAAEERVSLHRQAGKALEELFGEDAGPYLARLAHHFCAASAVDGPEGADKAVAYSTKAAESAMTTLAYEDAAAWYRRALDVLDQVPDGDRRRRYDLLMACADAEWRSHGFEAARETYRRAMRVAQALGSGELVGRAALGFAQGGGPERWVPVLEDALATLADEQNAVRAEVVVELALCKLFLNEGEAPTWVAQARRGLETVRRARDPDAAWRTLWSFHRALQFDPEALDERLAVSTELLELATERQDGERIFRARSYRIGDLFDTGDIAAVERELAVLDADARSVRLQYFQWVVTYMRAAVALHRGRVDEAEALAERALRAGEAVESLEVDNIYACQMLEIRRQQGRFEEMQAVARSAHQQFPHETLVPLSLALALIELGCVDEARHELSRWPAAQNPDTLSGTRAVPAWAYLTDVAWAMSDAGHAPLLLGLLRPHAGRHLTLAVAGASQGSTYRSLGQLAGLLERWDEAEEHFRSAHAMHERLGAHAWLAHGRTDHARMLLARGAVGDNERASDLLSQARAGFRQLGMTFYAQRAEGLLDELGAGARSHLTSASCRQEADGWVLEYEGEMVRLRESKGLRYLTRLLAHPGRQFSAVELIGGADPIDAERARHRVMGAVRSAIDRISHGHPQLGEHLKTTVRVGTTSSYVPDARAPVVWDTGGVKPS